MKIVAIVQARMGSSRLANKVLLDIDGKPLLLRLIERLQHSKKVVKIAIATTAGSSDDRIAEFADDHKIPCYRGSEMDLLDRFYRAAKKFKADPVVRVWGDSVLIDPAVVDRVITLYQKDKLDYCSNVRPASFPRGNDVEVFSFAALEKAWKEAKDPFYREYMTDYIFRNPRLFRVGNLYHKEDLSGINWCVDYKEDIIFAEHVIRHFGGRFFSFEDVLRFMKEHPGIAGINLGMERYSDYKAELKRKGLKNAQVIDKKPNI